MAEDDDYMSDKILTQCAASDIRPGLLFSKKQRRDHEMYKKKTETTRPFKVLAEERRNEGLNTAIPETNKGFELLAKMGYKPGSGVGKSKDGTCKPVTVELKEDKSGLGHESELKEKQKVLRKSTYLTYMILMKKRKELNNLKYDYSRIRRTCQYFDEKDDLKRPIRNWYWPEQPQPKSEKKTENDSDEESKKPVELLPAEELESRIEEIEVYMREKYCYCIWCQCQFDDDKDMTETCPGRSRQAHETGNNNQ